MQHFEGVNKISCLDSLVSTNNNTVEQICKRVQARSRPYFSLEKTLHVKNNQIFEYKNTKKYRDNTFK